MLIKCLCVLCLLAMIREAEAREFKKLEKRILYVGYSPEKEKPVYDRRISGYASEERFAKDCENRMYSFREMLLPYFSRVECVDCRDYRESMSCEYDVTIFDALPEPIVPRKYLHDSTGKYLGVQQEEFLSPGFDCPAIFIAHTGGLMRQGLDLKIDWCCLCLGAYAHHLKARHEVFRGPFPLKLTLEERATPLPVYNYLNGFAEPDRIPMWRVQTSSYMEEKGQRVGLVSFGEGFDDSPDAEVISGGVSLKAINTVAIGRHGNFLLWGFGASPEDLTPEAQIVFANCVAYISQFKGQRPVMRKDQPMTVRSFVDDLLWVLSERGYQQYVHKKQLVNADLQRQKEQTRQRMQENGGIINEAELDKKYALSEICSRDEFYRKYLGEELGVQAVRNREKCRKYILANRPYFYGAGTFNRFVIDEDVASLKIPNQDKRLLQKCIELWEKGEKVELAKRLLLRYTNHQFATPQEWREWYEKNKELLFFTEVGGYKFIENLQQAKAKTMEVVQDSAPVTVSMKLIRKEGKKYVSVRFRVLDGYHIYATLVEASPFVPTSLTFEWPQGVQAVGKIRKPAERLQEGSEGIMVYQGEFEFLQEITGANEGKIGCMVEYQCCNDLICMPPVKEKIIM